MHINETRAKSNQAMLLYEIEHFIMLEFFGLRQGGHEPQDFRPMF